MIWFKKRVIIKIFKKYEKKLSGNYNQSEINNFYKEINYFLDESCLVEEEEKRTTINNKKIK